jgi:hypothetical protein
VNYAWLINKGTKPARARLGLEALEARFVPSATALDLTTLGAVAQAGGAIFEQWAVRGQASVNASLGSISGTVFDVTNPANPVPITTPVTLSLFDAQGNLVATTTTTNGNYTFTGLVTGLGNLSTFTVVQTLPSGFDTNALDSQSFSLAQPGQQVSNVDFFDFMNPVGNPPRLSDLPAVNHTGPAPPSLREGRTCAFLRLDKGAVISHS